MYNVILINKTSAATPIELSTFGAPIVQAVWQWIDQAAYDAGGIGTIVVPQGAALSTTLHGYTLGVLEICTDAERCDVDKDGVPDVSDNCKSVANMTQADLDDDGVGDACDNGIDIANTDQANNDADGVGDVCDSCLGFHNRIDADADGVPDGCDDCLDSLPGEHVTYAGCRSPRADIDRDGDVDQVDFGLLQRCFNGPGQVQFEAACLPARLDDDLDVDLDDFGLFQACMSGANQPADPGCVH